MSRNLRLKATPVTDTLDNPRDEGRTIEHAQFARDADIRVDQRVVVGDHVFVWCIWGDGVFEGVG